MISEFFTILPGLTWSFVKSIVPLSVSPGDIMSSFILSIQHSLGLPMSHFYSNRACSASCGIQSW